MDSPLGERDSMNKIIANLNIEHYKQLLASEISATKRESITRLLADEEARLAECPKNQID